MKFKAARRYRNGEEVIKTKFAILPIEAKNTITGEWEWRWLQRVTLRGNFQIDDLEGQHYIAWKEFID